MTNQAIERASTEALSTLLIVMNPRRLTECIASLEALPVDQAWLTAYSERDLPINDVIATTDYDRYTVISDDAIVPPEALAHVLAAHDANPGCVVTGYSRLAEDDERVNLVDRPLAGGEVSYGAYSLMTQAQVDAQPPVFETWFAGYALTTASRQVWLDHPHPARENANDFYNSQSFMAGGIRILAVRDAKVGHVKESFGRGDLDPRRALYVGRVPAEIRWRLCDRAAV